ncbi:MAG: DMT family transporter [Pseudolabrys sp.]
MPLSQFAVRAAPLIFVFLWSTGFIGAKYGLPYVEPLTFLAMRMGFAVLVHALLVWWSGARMPNASEAGHSVVIGLLVHGVYLGGVFTAISQGVPAGVSALITGLQPILTSTVANRWLGEKVSGAQWLGLALGLIGVALVLNDRSLLIAGSPLGWSANVLSLLGITFGTLYQKRYSGGIDWRSGNLVQYAAAGVFFALGAFAFETRVVHWNAQLMLALAWLVLGMSLGAVALMYWLIRRSAAAGFASLFYLVPVVTALLAYLLFGEKLDALSIAGMAIAAAGVYVVNRAAARPLPR